MAAVAERLFLGAVPVVAATYPATAWTSISAPIRHDPLGPEIWPIVPGAPLVLMIHFGRDHRVRDAAAGRLSGRARVAAHDIRGHGLSAATPGAGVARHGADPPGLAPAPGARRALLRGLSIGQPITLEAAPDRVSGPVLADTAARAGSCERCAARADVRGGIEAVAGERVERRSTPGSRDRAPGFVAAMRATPERQPREGYLAAAAALAVADLGDRPRAIACPAPYLAGAEDRSTPPDQVQVLAAPIPGAELAVIEDAGHPPPVETAARTAGLARRAA